MLTNRANQTTNLSLARLMLLKQSLHVIMRLPAEALMQGTRATDRGWHKSINGDYEVAGTLRQTGLHLFRYILNS